MIKETTVGGDDALARVSRMAQVMLEAQRTIAEQEEQLRAAKAHYQKIEQEDLPELMTELGLTEIRLEDGSAVKVTPDIQCGISADRRDAAHSWLVAHGFGGLIKTAVVVHFNRDEHELALQAAEGLRKHLGRDADVEESVHPSTLKAFIKEQMAAGKPVPQETFAVHPFNRAKITPPTKRNNKPAQVRRVA